MLFDFHSPAIRVQCWVIGGNLKRVSIHIGLMFVILCPLGCGDEPTEPVTAATESTAAAVEPASKHSPVAVEPKTEPTPPPEPVIPPPPVVPKNTIDPGLIDALITAVQGTTKHPSLVQEIYKTHNHQPIFVDGKKNELATSVLPLLHDLASHAIDTTAWDLDPKTLTESALLTADTVDKQAALDLRLTQAIIDYVVEFRWIKRAHPFEFTKNPQTLIQKNHKAIVRDVLKALSAGANGLRAVWPQDDSYAVLRKELERYTLLEAQTDSQPKMPVVNLKPGLEGNNVTRLQQRLAFEAYYEGPIHGVYDEPTTEAVKLYQRTHQLSDDGHVGKKTVQSMNVPMTRRKQQIALGLQRWRESTSLRENATTFGRVNLPGFSMDIYEDGKHARRHRVIIGSNALDVDREGWKQGHLNRTPFLKTRIYQVILNPTWMVPQRIRKQEIEPALEKNPNLFEEKGYREITLSNGKTVIVQGSGEDNALGRVKFLLEKTNAIYLHDTDNRLLFRKNVRAFSHGCMRVHEALDFGKYLAQKYADKDEKKYKRLLRTKKPVPIRLEPALELYVEYNTVDITDGRATFLIDVYKYDKAFYNKDMPPRSSARYGAPNFRPYGVPMIPKKAYRALKAEGKPAPRKWPPEPPADLNPDQG